MKRILRWLVDGYHWLHAIWGMLIPLAAAYIFFSTPDMNWKIDAITVGLFAPFVAFGVILYQSMFRKKPAATAPPAEAFTSQVIDPVHQAQKNAR